MKNDLPEINSPKWVRKLLAMFLDNRVLEASLGDLEEKFNSRIRGNFPRWKAKFFFVVEALGFLKMARLPQSVSMQTTTNMISHTFLFFGRLVRKDLGYYLVSLLGLALSLTSFILIMLFIHDEFSYDQFHEKKDRLYRLTTHLKLSDVEYNMVTSPFPAAEAIQSEIPEVEYAVRIFRQEIEFSLNEKKFSERIIMADEHFFDLFSFSWLTGDKQTALNVPASIILTESMARKYFGTEDPLGKTLLAYDQPLTVTGVMKDVPEQSHLRFNAIVPLAYQLGIWKSRTGLEGRENKWFWIGAYTYVLLRNTASPGEAEAKLPLVVNKYFPDRYKQDGAFHLQAISDIHLTAGLSNEMEPGGNMLYVKLFSVVAFVIMIVSAINIINLSSFKIGSRMREVGIRKFLGQNAARIITQLSFESLLIGLLAFSLAILLCFVALPFFNDLVQKNFDLLSAPRMVIGATLAIIIAICLMAVIRPAMRYATQPSRYLLSQKEGNRSHAGERNVLIGLQVCFSFVLLVFSFIVSSQIDFFKNKDLGFDKQNVVLVELNEDIYSHEEAFKHELKKNDLVIEVSGGAVPGGAHNGWRFVPEGGSEERPFLFPLAWVDHDYLGTLKIKLLAGENFKPYASYEKDTLWPFLINKRAAIELGWADDPINKRMKVFAAGTTDIMAEGRVIGMMEDYNFESLHKPVKPVILTVSPGFGTALIRTSGHSFEEAIAHIGDTWKKFSNKPFVYELLDKKMDKLYTNEARLSNLILFFTSIALYLTCYGLFAMSSLLFSSRLKEVAIRKVFGADQLAIIKQFYSRYAVFNLTAIIVGLPAAIYLGNLWLETFQYRIGLDVSFFVKAGICVLVIGLLSVSYYLLKVAFSNPVRFLRNE
ncbi:MAG: ABC transporter permease [Cyclobacteriaceae bacterium]|nr:ABC transporter permease [Cyclobacteriaceae bacterium]